MPARTERRHPENFGHADAALAQARAETQRHEKRTWGAGQAFLPRNPDTTEALLLQRGSLAVAYLEKIGPQFQTDALAEKARALLMSIFSVAVEPPQPDPDEQADDEDEDDEDDDGDGEH